MAQWQPLSWKRRVMALGESPAPDRFGWPASSLFASTALGTPLADLRDVPVLVLRGEWGMGKSYALAEELSDLEAAGRPAALLALGTCGTSARRASAKLAEAFEAPSTPGLWHVFLDGLDEGIDGLADLDHLIIDQIQSLSEGERDGLRLRISCRTARWPDGLDRELGKFWSDTQVQTVGLVPLSREDVTLAARAMEVHDADSFTRMVQERDLVALATNPLTLSQLLTGYKDKGRLPATAAEAYRDACLHLCTETRRPKDAERRRSQATPEHLLAVAARVAAAMQFGAYTALSDNPPHAHEAGQRDLAVSSVESGDEPGHLGSPVACSMNELSQLTESSLLVPLEGNYRWAFSHRSYQEFLAAEFLKAHSVHAAVQRELLWIGDGQSRHVIPAHQAVAAWNSAHDSTTFEDLLRDDPLVLLLADLPSRPAHDRARVVGALLDLLQRDDTTQLGFAALRRLDHPDLAAQLRPYLRSDTEPNLLFEVVRIARACPCPGLSDALLTLAEDTALHSEIRSAAIAGVADLSDQYVRRLQHLGDDESAEVVATALHRLRPNHLTLTQLLEKVRDPDPDYIGTAYMLRREIPEHIAPAEISEAVAWANSVLWQPAAQGSPALAVAVLAQAVALAGQADDGDALITEVAQAMTGIATTSTNLFGGDTRAAREDLAKALVAADRVRRRLLRHLLINQDIKHVLMLQSSLRGGAILSQSDLLYWAENWNLLEPVDPQDAAIVFRFSKPDDPETLARCEAARAAHPTLREATAHWDTQPAENPYERKRRQAAEAERKRNTYSECALREALAAVMAAEPDTVRARWADVVNHMLRTADGDPFHTTEPLLTLAALAPSRPAPGSELSDLVGQAALHLMRTVPALSRAHRPPSGFENALELTAFAFLDELPPEVQDRPKLAGWAVALAATHTYHSGALELRQRFLPACAQRAGEALPELLADVLDTVHDSTVCDISHSLAATANEQTRSALLAWASVPGRRPEQWRAVVDELAGVGDEGALTALADTLQTDPTTQEPNSDERVRWTIAATAMLHSDRLPMHWTSIRAPLDDRDVLQRFLEGLGSVPNLPGSWPTAINNLPESEVADLYRLIANHSGGDAATHQPDQAGIVTADDRILEMTRSLPQILANRNTEQAATELRCLASQFPELRRLRVLAGTTARTAAARNIQPVPPDQLLALAAHTDLRVVRDHRQLLDIVVDSLGRFQQAIHRPNGLVVALWNRDRYTVHDADWWPCWEEDFSDIVATFLLQDIGGHRVVINREVQVLRPGFPGLRTDIQIEAPAAPGTGDDPIKVVIECKGCWNSQLKTALADQLVDGYLQAPRTAGVLLTAYFHCDRWRAHKRDCPARAHSLDDIRQHQESEAAVQGQLKHVSVAAVTLNCALPDGTTQWRTVAGQPEGGMRGVVRSVGA
ncbi:NACHT domain-containing protein [Kitasatospora sp. NPDC048365]|uniref:NACHT domain-containing protein n=1 Tax=Kitasatospora sp. NPDC048365 TaxID=3364050 RepID=UPI00371CAA9B